MSAWSWLFRRVEISKSYLFFYVIYQPNNTILYTPYIKVKVSSNSGWYFLVDADKEKETEDKLDRFDIFLKKMKKFLSMSFLPERMVYYKLVKKGFPVSSVWLQKVWILLHKLFKMSHIYDIINVIFWWGWR